MSPRQASDSLGGMCRFLWIDFGSWLDSMEVGFALTATLLVLWLVGVYMTIVMA